MKLNFLTLMRSPGLESAAYDNYDPAFVDNYDPEIATQYGQGSSYDPSISHYDNPGNMQNTPVRAAFDLVMANTAATTQAFELFNYLRSFTIARRSDLEGVAGTFFYIPLDSVEGLSLAGGGSDGTVGFNQAGDLVILSGLAVAAVAPAEGAYGATGAVNISCNQVPYRSLLLSSALTPFRITQIRATYTTAAQIDREVKYIRRSFLGGNLDNSINPRQYFQPNQFQNLIVDIPVNWNIDAESGFEYSLLAAETVKWNVSIERYQQNRVQ